MPSATASLSILRASHASLPKEIHLAPMRETDWPDADTRERLVDPLLKAGFRASERFVLSPLVDAYVQFFAHSEQCMTAALTKTRDHGTTLNLVSEGDGKSFSFTNRVPSGLDDPPNRAIHHAERANAKGLLYLMARHRPRIAWTSIAVDELPKRFEAAYTKDRAWRDERGFSEAEAMHFIRAQNRLRSGSQN
jgi:hypothetical protein